VVKVIGQKGRIVAACGRFSGFAGPTNDDSVRATDRQTHRRYSVCNNRPHNVGLRSTAMRSNNNNNYYGRPM